MKVMAIELFSLASSEKPILVGLQVLFSDSLEMFLPGNIILFTSWTESDEIYRVGCVDGFYWFCKVERLG